MVAHNSIRGEYQGFFAEFYDLLHERSRDAIIFPQLLKAYGTKVLEIGCGTGRLSIPLAKAGYEVTGLDNAPDMLMLLYAKEYPKKNLRIVEGDARCLMLDERYDVIILGCNFINQFVNADDVAVILSRCRKHLVPQGIVLYHFHLKTSVISSFWLRY